MKITDTVENGMKSDKRIDVQDTAASGGISNVSQSDNSPVMMNTPGMKERGFRADQLIEMAGDDGYRLGTEASRMEKMKG